MESYFAHPDGPGEVNIQAARLKHLTATSWIVLSLYCRNSPALAYIRREVGVANNIASMPVFSSLKDRFCDDLNISSQRWQQGLTKDGNRSKALSALHAYYPRDIGTVGVLSSVSSTSRPRNSFQLTSSRGSHETWVRPRQVSAGRRYPGPAVMCRRPSFSSRPESLTLDIKTPRSAHTPRKQRTWT
jgi:hypothetical protein